MILHNLKNAFRFIKRYSSFSAINISGLTVGIFCCLLIIFYIQSELTFDRFHKNGDNIYRVVMHQPENRVVGSSSDWWVVSPAILKPTWEKELPEVDLVTKTDSRFLTFRHKDQLIDEQVLFVDPEFLDIFTFPLKRGNQHQALSDPYSIIISNETAHKYFGEEDPIGKTMELNDGRQLTITGILKEIPKNSHLRFDFLVSFKTLEAILGRSLMSDNWLNNSYRTYLTLHENTDLKQFDAKLRKYDIEGFNGNTWTFHLQPLYDIHFNNQMMYGTGDKGTILIFITVGLFILFIACFNYLNLYISHYRTRLKDISVRKINGASKYLLIRQFFSESLMLILISYLLSLVIVWLIMQLLYPFFKEILNFQVIWSFRFFLASLGLIVLMALIAGAYPAIYLSRFHLLNALKGGMVKLSKESQSFRKVIVVIQFSLSVALIAGTVTIVKQMRFIGNKNLGYEKDNIVCLNMIRLYFAESYNLMNQTKALKQELLRNPDITSVSASTGIPCQVGWSNIPTWEGKAEDENPFFYRLIVDYDFLDLYGIQLTNGRDFSKDMATDDGNAYIINKAAAKRLGFQSPVNARFGFDGKLGTVVGVTGDFNFESLHKPVTPLGIGVKEEYYWQYISVKVKNTNIPETLEYIESVWNKFVPDYPMDYFFIDSRLKEMYVKDQQLLKSMNYLSLMALFISCLGIFGLMSFTLKERTKEIGIRKVMGASFPALVGLLTRDLLSIVCIAAIAGGVLGWYFSTSWLNNFAYRINWGIDIIIISSILTLLLAIIPISFNLIRSIRTNPVESLRYE
jgi:putative ABC transport system permease protein